MKTPRELLLQRHKGVESALNALSDRILANRVKPAQPAMGWMASLRRCFLPSPMAWGAIAACWIVILVLNVDSAEEPRNPKPVAFSPSAETLQAVREQKRLYVELVTTRAIDAEPTRFTRPRSDVNADSAAA